MTTESVKTNPPNSVKPNLNARDLLTISGARQHTHATAVGKPTSRRTPMVVKDPQYTKDAEYPPSNQYVAPQPNRATPMDFKPAGLDGQGKAGLVNWQRAAS